MKEEIVSFETAKIAKERGFDVYCREAYIETQEHTLPCRGGDYNFPYQAPRVLSVEFRDNYNTVIANAPTQSLLQRWLREIHNIHIKIHASNYNRFHTEVYNIVTFKNIYDNNPHVKIVPKTYEEALEIGLQKSLKQL